MCTNNVEITKDREREALQQIKDMVDSLGPNSYIATAFKGVFDIAEENIDNDFSGNPVDHAYDLGVQLAERTVQVEQLTEERDEYKVRAEAAEQLVIFLKAKLYDYMTAQEERKVRKGCMTYAKLVRGHFESKGQNSRFETVCSGGATACWTAWWGIGSAGIPRGR